MELHKVQNQQKQLTINTWYNAASDPSKPLVVHTHGIAGSSFLLHNRAIGDIYQEAGHPFLAIDSTHSNNTESSGDLENYTMGGQVEDVQTVLSWVGMQHPEWTNDQPVILSGHSMGGYVVLAIGASGVESEDIEIGRILSFSPVVSGRGFVDDFNPQLRAEWESGTHEEAQEAMETGRDTGKSGLVTSKHWPEWYTHDLTKVAGNIIVPVTLVQAGEDTITLPKHARALHPLIPNVTYKEIEGVSHGLRDISGNVVKDKIREIIDETLSFTPG